MSQQEWIHSVVRSFYDKAKDDVLIGYHFRIITDFDTHIPRIGRFWEMVLLGTKTNETFDVMKLHKALPIKRGEIGRWMVLFRKTLAETNEYPELKAEWEKQLQFFDGVFLRSFGL